MQRSSAFKPRLSVRKKMGSVIYVLFLLATMVGIVGLVVLLAQVLAEGAPWLNWNFLNSYPVAPPRRGRNQVRAVGQRVADGTDGGVCHPYRRGRCHIP